MEVGWYIKRWADGEVRLDRGGQVMAGLKMIEDGRGKKQTRKM